MRVRYETPDYLKGIAVIMMVIFHFFYDLNHFKLFETGIRKDLFWTIWPRIIISFFLISVGLNLSIATSKGINFKTFSFRIIKLSILALGISLATYFVFPGRWVYFGILHNVAVSSILAIPFLKRPIISLLTGISLISPSLFLGYKYPFISLSKKPVDHVALFPWFGLVLIGIFLHSKGLHKLKMPNHKFKKYIRYLGENSLVIYFLHQMILFPTIYLISRFL